MQELVLSSLTSTIRELLTQLDEVILASLRERILSFVERNADEQGGLSITHQRLGDHLGVTREAVSRELAALARSNKLSTGRSRIQLRRDRPVHP